MGSHAEIKKLIEAVEQEDSATGLVDAVEALAAARDEAAIPILIEVLGYNNPGAAVAAVDGLIALGEVTVPYLLERIDGYNYGARAWATRAFAGIGDPVTLELLLEAASSDFALSVRRSAAKGLGSIRWEKMPPQEVPIAQQRVTETLLKVADDPEWIVRYAAIVGLESLIGTLLKHPDGIAQIVRKLQQIQEIDAEIVVRARAGLVWQQYPLLSKEIV